MTLAKHVGGVLVDLETSDIFTMMNEYSYAAFVGVLSNIFMKAHASSMVVKTPYCAAIIVSKSMLDPYKGQPDTILNRLMKITQQMKEPARKVKIGFFVTDDRSIFGDKAKIGLKHPTSQCWPMHNESRCKDTITVNLPPPQLNRSLNKVRYFTINDIDAAIVNQQPVFMDYDTPIENLFESLSRSKAHICYQGGTAWLSVCLGIPTIIVHSTPRLSEMDDVSLKYKLFGQDVGNVNILNENKIDHVRVHPLEHHTHINDLKNTLRGILA